MVSGFMRSFRVLGSILLLGFPLVCPQPSTDHRKVPQRMAAAGEGDAEDDGGGSPGIWGTWGPWSACSRSCSGGVKEQTRPCLPGSARTPARAFTGRVLSAVRTSVPLHRSRQELRAAPSSDAAGVQGPASLRGSRHSQARGGGTPTERRGRTQGAIGPGRYGYGKAPYIFPLQTDSAHTLQRLRRQRPPSRQARAQDVPVPRTGYGPAAQQLSHHGSGGHGDHGPRSGLQAAKASSYQLPLTHDQGFPMASSFFQSSERSSGSHGAGAPGVAQSLSQPSRSMAISCIGSYRQYKLCNTQACPESSRSIREVQCASYNNKPFMGRFYEWEPFAEVKGDRKCELNCQAMGYRFYVRQAEKVIDGTPCDQNGTAICVSGQCKSIGCDDFLGSDKVVDKCGVCGGDNSGCQVVSGVFKRALSSLGYHRVLEIPQGATKINITEMHKSNNYLALRSRSGRSIINGNWAIDRPGKYEGGGTMFTYKRPNEISSTAGESFLAEGPTNEILDVYMIHQQPNPGVHYEYVIRDANTISPQVPPLRRPGQPFNGQLVKEDGRQDEGAEERSQETQDAGAEVPETLATGSAQAFPGRQPERFASHHPDQPVPAAPQPPRRSRSHTWKQLGTTECSATCGKGSQSPIFRCVHRSTHEEAPESYCDASMKPSPEAEPCNIFPCPAYWDIGEWSQCSKTCGLGMQHRQVLCRQVYANRSLTVQPYRCQHLERPETTSTCQLQICSEWHIRADWTSCSVPCGVGQRTRDVKCVSNIGDVVADEECNMKLRPSDIENCDMGPCAKSWFLTEWSERCSAECGAGVRTRSVVCMANHVSSLPLEGCGDNRPAEATPCDNGPCTGKVEWFAGSWSQCSMECGPGTQQREVICVRKNADAFEVLEPYACAFLERPLSRQPCHLKPCGATWFSTEWSMCSKSCQGGFRVREVRCLSDDMTLSNLCDPQLKPEERESCNPQDCVPEVDENCKDQYYNCNVVVQARLCVYSYYETACCASCTRGAQRQTSFLGSR